MEPIASLFERQDLPRSGMPALLADLYGGDFGVRRPAVYANFVSSVDGVVSLPIAGESGAVVSGHSEADRFVMGLLRACADAVLIGAGTFRAGAGDHWLPETVFPAGAEHFARLRAHLGLRPHPLLVVMTSSGAIDPGQPALRDSLILTSEQGEARLRGKLPSGARIAVAGQASCRAWIDLLREEGLQAILTEGGPTLFGELVSERLIDELFLTTSPLLFGRGPRDGRKPIVDGVELAGQPMELASARRHQSHLFLRYRLLR